MAADPWKLTLNAAEQIGKGNWDLSTIGTLMMLCGGTQTLTPGGVTNIADLTNELSGNGYARDTTITEAFAAVGNYWEYSVGLATFTASGGSLQPRYAVLIADSLASDPIIAYKLLDNTPANVTVPDGRTLSVGGVILRF